jgi:hypothetical protein
MFEHCTGYGVLDVLGKNWCAPRPALARNAQALTRPPARSRFLQFRGAYATARHPLVDDSTTKTITATLARVRARRDAALAWVALRGARGGAARAWRARTKSRLVVVGHLALSPL